MEDTLKKHSFKIQLGTAFFVLLFVWGASAKVSEVQARIHTINAQQENFRTWVDDLTDRQEELDDDNSRQDLSLVELRTRLTGIEALLIEIRNKV